MWNSTPTPPTYSAPAPGTPPPSGAEVLGAAGAPSPFLDEDKQRQAAAQHAHDGEAHLHLPPAAVRPTTQAQQGASARYGFVTPLVDTIARIHEKRRELGLPSPGTIENLQREVKCAYERGHRAQISADQ